MRAKSNKRLIEAIRLMRDYCRDGRIHPIITARDFRAARRLLRISVHEHHSWFGRTGWASRLREVGINPETLEVFDKERWAIAEEMIDASTKHFPITEFRRRLALARLKERTIEPEAEMQDEKRRIALEGLGIELE